MYRIGIIGSENSHAASFANYFNTPRADGSMNAPEFRVVAASGHYKDANKALKDNFGVEFIPDDFRDLIGKVDAVMVTARDGKFHYEFAEPFVKAGLPVFMDKPVTVSYAESKKLVDLAKKSGSLLCGGSAVKLSGDVEVLAGIVKKQSENIHGGSVIAPLTIESEHSGFWFYASHLVETSLAIFGARPKEVYAVRNRNDVTALINYDGYTVSNHFMDWCTECYQATVITKNRNYNREIDYSLTFDKECEIFTNMILNNNMPQTYEDLIYPVYLMESLIKSYEKGIPVKL